MTVTMLDVGIMRVAVRQELVHVRMRSRTSGLNSAFSVMRSTLRPGCPHRGQIAAVVVPSPSSTEQQAIRYPLFSRRAIVWRRRLNQSFIALRSSGAIEPGPADVVFLLPLTATL